VRSAVLNQCRSVLRRRTTSQAPRQAASNPESVRSAESAVLTGEERDEIMRAVRQLPPRQREALVLRFYLDMSAEETATTMGISPSSVRSATHRALASLGRMLQEQLLKERRISNAHRVHWLHSIALYLAFLTAFLIYTYMYAVNASHGNFIVTPLLTIVEPARWLFLTLVGIIYNGLLAYVMTEQDETYNRKHHPFLRVQAFFIVFFYALAYLAIYFATTYPQENARITSMVGSIVAFLISVLLYFVPANKFAIENEEVPRDYIFFTGEDRTQYGRPVPADTRTGAIIAYRALFLGFIVLYYLANIIIWFLSRGNGITDTLHFKNEIIAYGVVDLVFIAVFALFLIALTFYFNQKTLAITYADGTRGFAQPLQPLQTVSTGAQSMMARASRFMSNK